MQTSFLTTAVNRNELFDTLTAKNKSVESSSESYVDNNGNIPIDLASCTADKRNVNKNDSLDIIAAHQINGSTSGSYVNGNGNIQFELPI